ncbi:amidophosphoribosyltransferase [Veillonella denticariosi JCM 15641]|uniref:Amidophosphoribosyltransferase n=1 Tax=Veillonella denticariosi JCM 15641 TaxID=1298594 RepID=A0A2S7Z6W0_9FIRM|nr:double zinc ribbon domain-containing protein [Veillonella denticariosi]PQL18991.1 amidophosphoribosyltransferase [Veillonella denticariosi JCM 15641]
MSLWDFLFPPTCPHCGAEVASQGDWCESCFTELLHIRHVPNKFLHHLDDVCILADYKGGMKSMIYDVKFNEKKEQSKGAAPFLVSYNFYMHRKFNSVTVNSYVFDYIVPVPSGAAKREQRGYNQVDLFFKPWADALHHMYPAYFKWFDCLYKFDTERDMWSLTHKERQANINDAFMMHCDYDDVNLEGKRILIVDDIYTTGATLEAVAKILRLKRPKKLEALTLASGSF